MFFGCDIRDSMVKQRSQDGAPTMAFESILMILEEVPIANSTILQS